MQLRGVAALVVGVAVVVQLALAQNQALVFTNANHDSYALGPLVSFPTDQWTIEFWFQSQNSGVPFSVYGVGGANVPGFAQASNMNDIDIDIYGGDTGDHDANISNGGAWTHFAFVWENGVSGGFRVYINGNIRLQNTQTRTAGLSYNGRLMIGQYQNPLGVIGSNNDYGGALDEFRIWDVARTQAQILAGLNVGYLATEPNLVQYYRFDGDYTDKTGNADLTSTGGGMSFRPSSVTLAYPPEPEEPPTNQENKTAQFVSENWPYLLAALGVISGVAGIWYATSTKSRGRWPQGPPPKRHHHRGGPGSSDGGGFHGEAGGFMTQQQMMTNNYVSEIRSEMPEDRVSVRTEYTTSRATIGAVQASVMTRDHGSRSSAGKRSKGSKGSKGSRSHGSRGSRGSHGRRRRSSGGKRSHGKRAAMSRAPIEDGYETQNGFKFSKQQPVMPEVDESERRGSDGNLRWSALTGATPSATDHSDAMRMTMMTLNPKGEVDPSKLESPEIQRDKYNTAALRARGSEQQGNKS